ncbi:hypothetical protein [Corynebacterium tapiri]|uniref:ABC-type glycine betaine transport system substrate-binding domain-containing protein n=1 Tax=Corynebacterium tapiri TaxID=1448266 RepID=A0A5C4U6F7_9CORY|nr:hypothetical protein [Corynebacterium tapiri]TNL99682.1 hypothetical protein FHE74_01160 [Corynebacterium tapiri]
MIPIRAISLLCAGVLSGAGLCACAAQEPHGHISPESTRTVRISASEDDLTQQVLAEMYAQALSLQERDAEVVLVSRQRSHSLESINDASTDFVVACSGDLLAQINPNSAEQVAAEADDSSGVVDPNDDDLIVATYEAAMASLPTHITSTDSSSAQGCTESPADSLPQSIMPVFRKSLFDRNELKLVTDLTKVVTNEELDRTVEKAQKTSAQQAVEAWFGSVSLATNADSQSNSKKNDTNKGIGESPEK